MLRLQIVIGLLLFSSPAFANRYTVVAASCVPNDVSLNNNRYGIYGVGIQHQGSNVDLITMNCAVSTNISAPSHLELTFSSTQNSASNYVTATYVKVNKSTGAVTTIATASSRDSTNDGQGHLRDQTFTDTYDSSVYWYFVRFELLRSSSTQNVQAIGASLR